MIKLKFLGPKIILILLMALVAQQGIGQAHARVSKQRTLGPVAQSEVSQSRGYQTTPLELQEIKRKADTGLQPYANAVDDVLEWADQPWDFQLDTNEDCENSNSPAWIDNRAGVPIIFSKALAYHLTGDQHYAQEVKSALEAIMANVETITLEEVRCRLVFGWGIPEIVSSADLIEDYWQELTCQGPLSTNYEDTEIGEGDCKTLFQNWLVKNPYYVSSFAAEQAQSNWGASATNSLAFIADYLWDRPEVVIRHRVPPEINGGEELTFSPAEAYAHANQLTLDRMNGYRVDYHSSSSCDFLGGSQQLDNRSPLKSQIAETGIIPEDARRQQYCNIEIYNGNYQNYPQVHLGNNIQQCELMLRRGDSSCYDNIDMSDIADYTFVGPDGETKITHLYPGRGSIERAIDAVIVDSDTEWRHDSALELAFRYYYNHHQFDGVPYWFQELDRPSACDQDACFGTLTHGFSPGEELNPPPVSPLP